MITQALEATAHARWRIPGFRADVVVTGFTLRTARTALHSHDAASLPFAPRSGEKVVRQHRMRGRGR